MSYKIECSIEELARACELALKDMGPLETRPAWKFNGREGAGAWAADSPDRQVRLLAWKQHEVLAYGPGTHWIETRRADPQSEAPDAGQ